MRMWIVPQRDQKRSTMHVVVSVLHMLAILNSKYPHIHLPVVFAHKISNRSEINKKYALCTEYMERIFLITNYGQVAASAAASGYVIYK